MDLPHNSHSIKRKTLTLKEIKIDDQIEHEMVELDEHETKDESTSDDSSDEPTETSSREYLLARQ